MDFICSACCQKNIQDHMSIILNDYLQLHWYAAGLSNDAKVDRKRQASQSSSRNARQSVLTSGKSVSFQSMERLWSKSLWKPFPSTQMARKMAGKKRDRFAQNKFCLTSLIALQDERSGSMHKRRAVVALYLDCINTFSTISCTILTAELVRYRQRAFTQWATRFKVYH